MAKRFKHKFKVSPPDERRVDGILFHSKKERKRYEELKFLQGAGVVLFFLRQVPFDLPGGSKWRCDFLVFYTDGTSVVEDVKGHRTTDYKKAKRQVEALYPIEITEI